MQPAEGRLDAQRSEFKVSAVNRTHTDMIFSIRYEFKYLNAEFTKSPDTLFNLVYIGPCIIVIVEE